MDMKSLLDNNGVKRLVQNIKNWVTPLINEASTAYLKHPNSILVRMQDGEIVVNLIENNEEIPLQIWHLYRIIGHNKPISIVINLTSPIVMSNSYRISNIQSYNYYGSLSLSIFINNNNNTIYYLPDSKDCVIKKDDFHDMIVEYFFSIYKNNPLYLANEKIRLHDVFQKNYNGKIYNYKSLPIIELKFDEVGNIINPSKIYFNNNYMEGNYFSNEATADISILDDDIYIEAIDDRELEVYDIYGVKQGILTQYRFPMSNSKGEYVQACSYESLDGTKAFHNVYRKIDCNILDLYKDEECTERLISNPFFLNITHDDSLMYLLKITNIRDNNNNYMSNFIMGYRQNGIYILNGVNNYFECNRIDGVSEHTTINASYCKVTKAIGEVVEDDFTSI